MTGFCRSLTSYHRRDTLTVDVGGVGIGGGNPVRVQSMTNTDTLDTGDSAAQVVRISQAGGELVRLTAQGKPQAENLGAIHSAVRAAGCGVPLVADIHFTPEAAFIAAEKVEKVRINPGNFDTDPSFSNFRKLIDICRRRSTALRIGVNHGSLSPSIMERYGDTIEGMVASAMEYLEVCREEAFDQVVVSMKSSNVRVMIGAYRLLCKEMEECGMRYPLHLGVTEAGSGMEARVKSAVGIGALMVDGIGDTIRVSLTEDPEAEIPVGKMLIEHYERISGHTPIAEAAERFYSPYEYRRRISDEIEGIGGGKAPVLWSEMTPRQRAACVEVSASNTDIPAGKILILTTSNANGTAEQRAFFTRLDRGGLLNPVIIKRTYSESDLERLTVASSADMGMLFIDGYGDGIWIENTPAGCGPCGKITPEMIDAMSLSILQAARVRISQPEYIACPGCGRTLYDIQRSLEEIKRRTSHLVGVKIGVMGCIVNGPGEMADADYGYVGAGRGRITLYKGREVVKRNVPESEAIDELLALIEGDK